MHLLIPTIITLLSLLLLLLLLFKPFLSSPKLHKTKPLKLPPSPPSLPFIGHLHLFKKPLHHTLSSLSSLYGPILHLNFSSRRLLIISSHSLALQCFTTLDLTFATRPRLPSGRFLTYNYTTIGFSPYGPHWRTLRRIVAHHLFSPARLQSLVSTRSTELNSLLHRLYNSTLASSSSLTRVELRPKLFELVLNVLMMGIAGKRYSGEDQARRFFEIVRGTFTFSGTSNLRDFLPKIVRMFDFQGGTRKRLAWLESEWDLHLQGLIDEERMKSGGDQEAKEKTMIGVLLSLQQENPQCYTDRFIKALFLSLLMAGTDTSTATLEWAMSLLLNHPEKLKKAQEEIDEQIEHGRLIEENDLPNLPYLQGIINESLRLYPATPLLLPHESTQDCELNGFHVPQGTILLVNVYAMHRDPEIWGANAGEFRPERYEESGTDLSKMMMPFGMGRRSCPGEGLALKLVGLALGALIQCFEWERLGQEMVDMDEALGMSMPKATPLVALYKPRPSMITVLTNL